MMVFALGPVTVTVAGGSITTGSDGPGRNGPLQLSDESHEPLASGNQKIMGRQIGEPGLGIADWDFVPCQQSYGRRRRSRVAEVNVQPLRAAPTLGNSTSLSFRMPLLASQMNASNPNVEELLPTTTDPSAETANAVLPNDPPARSPRPTMPPPLVQRNASCPDAELPLPTTTDPSAEAP